MEPAFHGASRSHRGAARVLEANRDLSPLRRKAQAFLQASRLLSHPSIALPLVLGQILGARSLDAPVDLTVFVVVQLFGLFDQLYIVYANDVADEATDRRNTTHTAFSGGSRVLVDRLLSPHELRFASSLCLAACFACSLGLAIVRDAPELIVLTVVAALLLWAYCFAPARLSYRGGGELLQMLGLAVVLPLYGYCAQRGSLDEFPWGIAVTLLPVQLASAIATTLPDEPSDRESGKRTVAVRFGGARAGQAVGLLGLFAVSVAYVFFGEADRGVEAAVVVPLVLNLCVLALGEVTPGSDRMTAKVALAITASLAVVCILIAHAL